MNYETLKKFTPLLLLAIGLAGALWVTDRMERTPLPAGPRETRAVAANSGVTFTPPSGVYAGSMAVEIRPQVPRAPVVFTLDGTAPTTTVGMRYTHPLRLDVAAPGVTVVRAREFVNGAAGPIATSAYIVGVTHTLPILSIAADPVDLWSADRGILLHTEERGDAWERPVYLTFFEDHRVSFETPAGLRYQDNGVFQRFWQEVATSSDLPPGLALHGERPVSSPKPSLRLYFRADYGGSPTLQTTLFSNHPQQTLENQNYRHLLLAAGDRTGRWTLLQEPLVADIANVLGLPAAQTRPVLLFINGQTWGIYLLSERLDNFYLDENFGIQTPDLIRSQKAREGDSDQWAALMSWVKSHPLDDSAAYAMLREQMDVDSFTDYAILRLYFGFPENALSVARAHDGGGRWFWIYGNGGDWGGQLDPTHEPSLFRTAATEEDFGLLFQSLMKNDAYQTQFIARSEVLLNTVLAPEAMAARIEQLAAMIRPDIGYEVARWPSLTDWEANVAALRDFAARRPALMHQQLATIFPLGDTTTLTLTAEPASGGQIYLNGWPLPTIPWAGHVSTSIPFQAIAVPAPDYAFAGWSDGIPTASHAITAGETSPLTAYFALIPANDPALHPDDVMINEYWINDNGTHYPTVNDRPIEGDWIELLVRRHTTDLRGWRLTDNDTKAGTGEGSIILPQSAVLAAVPRGTVILILASETPVNTAYFPQDDLDLSDGRLIFYVGNGNLDVKTDPGFGIGTGRDALALLAPGPTTAFTDDIGVDFVAEGNGVTPVSFGILADGVVFPAPFRGLGGDDGAYFTGQGRNDDTAAWRVDPPDYQSGDARRLGSVNQLTPGALNPGQRSTALRWEWVVLGGCGLLLGLGVAWRRWHTNHRRPGAKRLTTQQ